MSMDLADNSTSTKSWPQVMETGFMCVVYLLLIFCGTIGNLIGIVVIRATHAMRSSRGVFTALALSDTLVLWINPLRYWLLFVFGYDLRLASATTCKAQTFATYASRDWATWVLCLLTFERFLFAYMPHRSRLLWKSKRRIAVWATVFCLIILKNSSLLWKLNIMEPSRNASQNGTTTPLVKNRVLCDTKDIRFRIVFFFIDITFYSLLPTLLLLIFNITLLRIIHRARKNRILLTNGESGGGKTSVDNAPASESFILSNRKISVNKNNQLESKASGSKRSTVAATSRQQANHLLIPVSMFHLVTSLPLCVFSVVEASLGLKQTENQTQAKVIYALGRYFSLLSVLSNGINCLIYFLSSRLFRKRLSEMVRAWQNRPARPNLDSSCNGGLSAIQQPSLQPLSIRERSTCQHRLLR